MSMIQVKYCPGLLKEGHSTYCPAFLKRMFEGKKVSHIFAFSAPDKENNIELLNESLERISISGVQPKYSIRQEKNKLELIKKGERGKFLLKPVPPGLRNRIQLPANEHLTMQIARQVFNINTAENCMIFFNDGSPAYLTKRFDYKENSEKWRVEDFASLAGKTPELEGDNFKYNYSYEEGGAIIRKYVPAWPVEMEKYFRIILFNFLFSNEDAHLKNFSLVENRDGDFLLSPAYDLLNTRLHISDSDFALERGLFHDDYKSERYKRTGHPSLEDFREFAKRLGISETRTDKLVTPFIIKQPRVADMAGRSFLERKSRKTYLQEYFTRLNFFRG